MIKYFTEFHFHGLIIRDPQTALSNLLMFLAGMWCFFRISKFRKTIPGAEAWRFFFFFFALATFVGIFVHGFSAYTPQHIHFWIWISMGWLQMIGVFFAQVGTTKLYFKEKVRMIIVIGLLQFIFCGILMIITRKFAAVNIDTGVGLLPIMFINFSQYKRRIVSSTWLGIGIATAAIPAVIAGAKLSISEAYFNFNDLSHLLVIACTIMMCVGLERNFSSVKN